MGEDGGEGPVWGEWLWDLVSLRHLKPGDWLTATPEAALRSLVLLLTAAEWQQSPPRPLLASAGRVPSPRSAWGTSQ